MKTRRPSCFLPPKQRKQRDNKMSMKVSVKSCDHESLVEAFSDVVNSTVQNDVRSMERKVAINSLEDLCVIFETQAQHAYNRKLFDIKYNGEKPTRKLRWSHMTSHFDDVVKDRLPIHAATVCGQQRTGMVLIPWYYTGMKLNVNEVSPYLQYYAQGEGHALIENEVNKYENYRVVSQLVVIKGDNNTMPTMLCLCLMMYKDE